MAKGAKFPAWARSPEEVAAHHGSDVNKGLTDKQVETQREKYGFNELDKEPGKPLWKLVLEQFDDALVKILLLAACVSLLLAFLEEDGHEGIRAYIEPLVILLILVLNAIVGVWQESNAENALEALKEMQSEHAKTMRNGTWVSDLPAKELVPGDIVELHVGDKVPADMRVVHLKTATLRLEQASLTGESVAVNKQEDAVPDEDCEIQAKESMLFAGTAVANGSCIAIVNDIGMQTEIGEIQEAIQEAAGEEDDTPLKKKLDEFGELLTKVIGVVCLLVWLMNYRFFISWKTDPGSILPKDIKFDFTQCTYYFKIAVALAVAAIPEGLPAVITTCLALGTRKMAQKNAIVRKLPSVETLGCTTVICSDKTGTLTTNQMSAIVLVAMDKSDIRVFDVEGSTYNPTAGKVVGLGARDANLAEIARVATICNESTVENKDGAWVAVGAPTEAALKVLAEKIGADGASGPLGVSDLWLGSTEKLATLEFDRDRKSMSCIVTAGGGGGGRATRSTRAKSPGVGENTLLVKGAPESVLERCTYVMMPNGEREKLTVAMRQVVARQVEGMSKKALRCLAMAVKSGADLGPLADYDGPHHPAHKQLLDPANYSAIESDLILVGLAGLQDPPRPEVSVSIGECTNAGIRVMMITGDNKLTAEAIATNIGIIEEGVDLAKHSMTGRDFMSLPRSKQVSFLSGGGGRVFSRAEPRHKQEIVRLLKEQGEIAAMTGDGVNDAPALKLADIGVAMGIAGTEVAKEASDMVLADDNFSSIVAAVSEGRSIFNNMKAFIRYMISSNIGEVASIFLTAALGMPEGLIPVQLLWVNLVTDGPPATALGFNPADPDIMDKPPRKSDDALITPWVFLRYMVVGIYVGFATVAAFAIWFLYTDFMGIDLSQDGHSTVTWYQLTHWQECRTGGAEWRGFKVSPYTAGSGVVDFNFAKDPCEIFEDGKAKASTLSLSVLVAIEMFNAVNALSEDNSLFSVPPWVNPYLIVAMFVSFGLHFVILYVPFLSDIFSIVPLNANEWVLVVALAFPVIVIDEVLKAVGRMREAAATAKYKKEH